MTAPFLHDQDVYGWVVEPGAALQAHDSSRLDWNGLKEELEELEALGRQDDRELVRRLGVLPGHRLPWERQPERRSRSWFLRVREQRRAITRLLEQDPSLRPRLEGHPEGNFQAGVDPVRRETELALRTLPQASPWSLAQVLDPATLCDTCGDWNNLCP